MSDQLDTERVLVALTDGIGSDLGRPVRASYYELLKRLKGHEEFLRLDHISRQEVVDLLALSLFYSNVVAPLESGRSLLSLVQRANATHIRIGRDKLTPKLATHFGACAAQFHMMLAKHRIPVRVLSFSTLSAFMANVHIAKEFIRNEAMDRSTDAD